MFSSSIVSRIRLDQIKGLELILLDLMIKIFLVFFKLFFFYQYLTIAKKN